MSNLSYGPFLSRKQAQAQGLKHHFTGKPCKRGHIDLRFVSSGECIKCSALKQKAAFDKDPKKCRARKRAWTAANKDTLNSRRRQRYEQDPAYREQRLKAGNAWRAANPDLKAEQDRRYRQNNAAKLKVSKREYERARRASDPEFAQRQRDNLNRSRKQRWESDPNFRASCVLRNRLKDALNGVQKADTTRQLVGCTWEELVAHIAKQFLPGMTWDNYSYETWHIDHIRPCASFDLTDPEQQRQCFHYTNLQPLWATDNLQKSDKWVA